MLYIANQLPDKERYTTYIVEYIDKGKVQPSQLYTQIPLLIPSTDHPAPVSLFRHSSSRQLGVLRLIAAKYNLDLLNLPISKKTEVLLHSEDQILVITAKGFGKHLHTLYKSPFFDSYLNDQNVLQSIKVIFRLYEVSILPEARTEKQTYGDTDRQ